MSAERHNDDHHTTDHIPGGWSCGDTTDMTGNCVIVVDGEDGRLVAGVCPCECHEGDA